MFLSFPHSFPRADAVNVERWSKCDGECDANKIKPSSLSKFSLRPVIVSQVIQPDTSSHGVPVSTQVGEEGNSLDIPFCRAVVRHR